MSLKNLQARAKPNENKDRRLVVGSNPCDVVVGEKHVDGRGVSGLGKLTFEHDYSNGCGWEKQGSRPTRRLSRGGGRQIFAELRLGREW